MHCTWTVTVLPAATVTALLALHSASRPFTWNIGERPVANQVPGARCTVKLPELPTTTFTVQELSRGVRDPGRGHSGGRPRLLRTVAASLPAPFVRAQGRSCHPDT